VLRQAGRIEQLVPVPHFSTVMEIDGDGQNDLLLLVALRMRPGTKKRPVENAVPACPRSESWPVRHVGCGAVGSQIVRLQVQADQIELSTSAAFHRVVQQSIHQRRAEAGQLGGRMFRQCFRIERQPNHSNVTATAW